MRIIESAGPFNFAAYRDYQEARFPQKYKRVWCQEPLMDSRIGAYQGQVIEGTDIWHGQGLWVDQYQRQFEGWFQEGYPCGIVRFIDSIRIVEGEYYPKGFNGMAIVSTFG